MSLEKFLAMSDGSGEHEPECLSNAMFPARVAMASVGYPPCICDQLRIATQRIKKELVERISTELVSDVEIRWRNNAIQRIRNLHRPHMFQPDEASFIDDEPQLHCWHCATEIQDYWPGEPWPCPTIKALDGEQA